MPLGGGGAAGQRRGGAHATVAEVLTAQRERLEAARQRVGDYVSPFKL